jgi:mannose-1-phosphate guanylyltransferase
MDYGMIMAGGSGTRLWPLSRKGQPKQLLPLIQGRSLLQLSYDRLRASLPADRIYVCTKSDYAESVFANLPDLPRENLLGEPEGRDTANAVGFAAAVLHKRDPTSGIRTRRWPSSPPTTSSSRSTSSRARSASPSKS